MLCIREGMEAAALFLLDHDADANVLNNKVWNFFNYKKNSPWKTLKSVWRSLALNLLNFQDKIKTIFSFDSEFWISNSSEKFEVWGEFHKIFLARFFHWLTSESKWHHWGSSWLAHADWLAVGSTANEHERRNDVICSALASHFLGFFLPLSVWNSKLLRNKMESL